MYDVEQHELVHEQDQHPEQICENSDSSSASPATTTEEATIAGVGQAGDGTLVDVTDRVTEEEPTDNSNSLHATDTTRETSSGASSTVSSNASASDIASSASAIRANFSSSANESHEPIITSNNAATDTTATRSNIAKNNADVSTFGYDGTVGSY